MTLFLTKNFLILIFDAESKWGTRPLLGGKWRDDINSHYFQQKGGMMEFANHQSVQGQLGCSYWQQKENGNFRIVIGNSIENVLACLSASQSFYSQPILVEHLALWRTIEFCIKLGLGEVVLEGDAQVIINVMQQEEHDWSWYEGLIEDIKYVMWLQQKLEY